MTLSSAPTAKLCAATPARGYYYAREVGTG